MGAGRLVSIVLLEGLMCLGDICLEGSSWFGVWVKGGRKGFGGVWTYDWYYLCGNQRWKGDEFEVEGEVEL